MKNSPTNWLAFFRQMLRGRLKRFPYEPLITVELSRSRLLHNLNEFRAIAPRIAGSKTGAGIGMVAPVLKSNAYGHGLFEIADILEEENGSAGSIPFFVVDSYFEAVALRTHGIRTPILIVGYTRPETMANSTLKNIAFAVTGIETLRSLAKLYGGMSTGATGSSSNITGEKNKKTVSLHLKIDTGMHRQGVLPAELGEAVSLLKKNQWLGLDGAMTHLSDADNADHTFTEQQIETWNTISRRLKAEFPSLRYLHASATDGHRFAKKIEANVSRLGIGLYGLSDDMEFARKMHLEPVLSMKTIVTGTRQLKSGETTGYGNTFTAWRDTTIATIPVGYFEGLNRKLSNNGSVIVLPGNSQRVQCPIVGQVSMNITTIEIPTTNGKEKPIGIGTPVIAISDTAADANSIASIAKKSGTKCYEIAVHIPAHLKRMVV